MSSYQLADGTYSDQYKLGDKFVAQDNEIFKKGTVVVYLRNDGSDCPWFIEEGGYKGADASCFWWRLSAYVENTSPTHSEVEELEAKIENLEEYISELVKENEQLKKQIPWDIESLRQQSVAYNALYNQITTCPMFSDNEETLSKSLVAYVKWLQLHKNV